MCECSSCVRLNLIYAKAVASRETEEQEDIASRWRSRRTEEKRLGC